MISNINQLAFAAQPIVLRNADSLLGITFGNNQVRHFVGNVMFEQGTIIITCDTAVQYIEENRVDLSGNVVIDQNSMKIKSPLINYNGNTRLAVAKRNVEIQDTNNILNAESGNYDFDTKIAEFKDNVTLTNDSMVIYAKHLINNTGNDESFADGDVQVFGKYVRTALISDTLIHKPKQSFTLAYGNAGFFYIDTVKKGAKPSDYPNEWHLKTEEERLKLMQTKFDTLSIFSRTIFGNQMKGQEFFQFLDSVEICKGSISSKCDKADYFKTGDSLILTGNPIVWYDNLQLFADTINVIFPKRQLQSIKLFNNSFAISEADSLGLGRINQISGKNIDLNFANDSINCIISKNNATSLYFMTDDSGETGAQSSGADTITIFFEANDVSNILWRSAAFIDFYPERIFPVDIKTLYLPRFRMRDDIPERKKFPIKSK
ncbi:MAG: LPS export ABC transporter periplasmic protein LptC [Ignavibacteria bacterium GWF2_33_9]|nr:MAG: LPS export ABC transporter periplasmic protein LptC [Ignavibacteria bacterium GWF2_33_9]